MTLCYRTLSNEGIIQYSDLPLLILLVVTSSTCFCRLHEKSLPRSSNTATSSTVTSVTAMSFSSTVSRHFTASAFKRSTLALGLHLWWIGDLDCFWMLLRSMWNRGAVLVWVNSRIRFRVKFYGKRQMGRCVMRQKPNNFNYVALILLSAWILIFTNTIFDVRL